MEVVVCGMVLFGVGKIMLCVVGMLVCVTCFNHAKLLLVVACVTCCVLVVSCCVLVVVM